ncbi:unnamed protein product, partial [Heterosigma akashiwo]
MRAPGGGGAGAAGQAGLPRALAGGLPRPARPRPAKRGGRGVLRAVPGGRGIWDVVAFHVDRSPEEVERNTAVKDHLRARRAPRRPWGSWRTGRGLARQRSPGPRR